MRCEKIRPQSLRTLIYYRLIFMKFIIYMYFEQPNSNLTSFCAYQLKPNFEKRKIFMRLTIYVFSILTCVAFV